MPTPRNPAGFTLIELMIVIGVLAILSGMAMPILGMARHTARVSETRSLMAKADAAIRQFKGEVGVWPYQKHDAAKDFPEAGNRLAWHLGHTLTSAESATLGVDLTAATAAYDIGTHKPLATDIFHADGGTAEVFCIWLADMGKLRARIAVMSGNSGLTGIAKDRTTAILTAPKTGWAAATSDHPGWGDDYLAGEVPPKRIIGHGLHDAWGQPLVYVSPVVPGVRLTTEGKDRIGWDPSIISEAQYGLAAAGRMGSGSMNEDVRTTAAPSFALAYELSSMGRDMQTAAMRNDPATRDDILAGPYRKDLQ
jgi:prepilin-type N-terminal cleavage/methylation domain-containing protein